MLATFTPIPLRETRDVLVDLIALTELQGAFSRQRAPAEIDEFVERGWVEEHPFRAEFMAGDWFVVTDTGRAAAEDYSDSWDAMPVAAQFRADPGGRYWI